jgi:hypothetical protein
MVVRLDGRDVPLPTMLLTGFIEIPRNSGDEACHQDNLANVFASGKEKGFMRGRYVYEFCKAEKRPQVMMR